MSIEAYVHLVSDTPFPVLFLLGVIFLEYVGAKWKGISFSFRHVFSNFAVLGIGIISFTLFNIFFLSRESVLHFVNQHSFFHTGITWTWFVVWLVMFDFINYLTHVLYHKSSFFWMFHAVHHSDRHLDASTTIRVPITSSFFTVSAYAFLGFCGVNVVLLPVLAQTMFFQQILVHSTLLRGKVPLIFSRVLVTPDIHALHHTQSHMDRNYGFLFTWWDRLFGTAALLPHAKEEFGVLSLSSHNNPFLAHIEPVVHFFKS